MPEERFACKKCSKKFPKLAQLEQHRRAAHPLLKQPVVLGGAAAAVLVVAVLAILSGSKPTQAAPIDFEVQGQPMMGNTTAPVVMVAFEDPSCPACRAFHLNTMPSLKSQYIDTGKVVVYAKSSSIESPWTYLGLMAIECAYRHAGDEGFWGLSEHVFMNQARITSANLRQFVLDHATEQGWPLGAFTACVDRREASQEVEKDLRKYRETGVRGDPAFFIFKAGKTDAEPTVIVGPQSMATFTAAIERHLQA